MLLAYHEIIADEHAGNGPEKSGVSHQPAEDVAAVIGHQLPRLHSDADEAVDEAADTKTDAARREIGEIVGGGNHVGGHVDVEGGHQQSEHRDDDGHGIAETRENRDRIPQRLTEDDERGGSDGDADEGVEGHRGGKPESLADDLVALTARVASEIGDVQRDGGPEANYAGERRNEEAEEFPEGLKFGWRGEHGPEAAGLAARPQQEREPNQQEKWRGNALQIAD